MRRQTDRMASAGYLAILPDLYSQGGRRRCLRATFTALRSGEGRAYRDIEAARSWLLAQEDCTGKVGVIGFCMGGAFALMAASGHSLFNDGKAGPGWLQPVMRVLDIGPEPESAADAWSRIEAFFATHLR